ncbi:reverse transcriptase domain-containing protein [Tanacetum coccineum]
MDIRMSRLEKMISEKNVTTPATVKAVEEVCVTCGANHNFNNCPLTRNEFPVFHDNIHQFQQTAAVGNFVQRNPPNLASQIRPPGFNVQNNQGNQIRYQGNNFNSNQNRGNNFNENHQNNQGQVFQPPTNQPPVYQVPPYQAPTPQIQGVSKTDFENYVKANDAVLKNVQNQGQNLQNQMANVTSLLTSLCNNFKNSASTSNSGTLPSQTVTNPRQQINAITTRSGKTLEGPSTPLVPTPVVSNTQKEPEQNPETSTEKVQNPNLENTAHVPPPEEEDSIFIEIPKPKAKKTVNVEIQDLNSPKPTSYQSKLPYPERMKVRENDKPSAQHSRFLKMFKQLRLEIGLKDALVKMPKFNKWLSSLLRNKEKLEEIAITTVNAECSAIIMNKVPEKLEDPRKFLIPCALQELNRTKPEEVPIILGRPSLHTEKALIDLYEETLTLRIGKEELVYYADKSKKNKDKNFVHAISVIDFLKADPFSGSTTNILPPSSSLTKTSDNFEKFAYHRCMRTRSQTRNRNHRQQQIIPVIVEEPEIPMADNRTMPQMLQAPIEGYEDGIVVPPINANNFKLKQTFINLVQSEARTWLDKEPPRSILTWDDLVSKFINQFFPPSETTYLRNEITTFYQKPNETFNEAWERFKGLLRQCPHHGFSELNQLDTFYNSLNTNYQDALDSAAGGNFLDKMPRDGLAIIESKSKVRYSRSHAIEPRVSTNAPLSTSTPSNSFEFQQIAASLEDKMDIQMSRLEKMISEKNVTTLATVKAVEEPISRKQFQFESKPWRQFQSKPSKQPRKPKPIPRKQFQLESKPWRQFQPKPSNNQGAVYQAPPYQPPTNQPLVNQALPPVLQIQGVSKTDFDNYVKANDAVLKNVQNQGQNLQNQMANVTSLLTSLCDNFKNSASTLNSGTLPSQTLSSLLRNKEKLEEIAITTMNAECSAIIMNKVPEKLEDPGKFLIPCALQELDRTSAVRY